MAAPHRACPRLPRLRAWQRAALQRYREVERRPGLPGHGDARRGQDHLRAGAGPPLIDARVVDRVIVVCPTDHLRTQWADAAAAAGLPLDAALTNAVGPVRPDLRGYVTTYAQVAAKPALHAARATAKRSLVILDEVHHAGDGLSWGDAVADRLRARRRAGCA